MMNTPEDILRKIEKLPLQGVNNTHVETNSNMPLLLVLVSKMAKSYMEAATHSNDHTITIQLMSVKNFLS